MNPSLGPMLTVVAQVFPPQVSGSAILLANLLSNYSGRLSAVAGYDYRPKSDAAFLSPCPIHYLKLPYWLPRLFDRMRRRVPKTMCYSITGAIRRALQKLGTDIVMASFPHDVYVVAAFLAARRLKLPFYIHMHDLWTENCSLNSATYKFAEQWEPIILKESTRVLCMTETMQEYYEKKFGIRTDILPHSVSEQDFLKAPTGMLPALFPKPTVLFVGSVTPQMNLDSLKVLAAASELLPQEYELLYCTPLELTNLNRLGIQSSRLRAKYVSRAEVQHLQSEAHVLVAPLSHKNCSADEVHTVFSTKLLEYLISGRPIVVFAPKGSYHAEFAKKNGWGYVVAEDSPEALMAAIVKVTTDENLATSLVRGALREAQSRRAKRHAERLWEWVLTDTRTSPYQPLSPSL
jgi:glycosyltransferase involved in cell wall biosynthesis